MPFVISGLGGALATLGAAAGVTTAAAGVATGAMAVAGAVGTVVASVGIVMSVVGLVTGDEDLTKIGGIMGLAGGAVSLGASAFSGIAATGAAPAAGETAKAAANVAANAAPAASQITTQAASPVAQNALEGTAALGSNAVQTAAQSGSMLSQAGIGAAQNTTPSVVGPNVGNAVKEAGFFDTLMSPQNMQIGQIAAGVFSGMAEQDNADANREMAANNLNFQKQQWDTEQANANSIGNFSMNVRKPTAEEISATNSRKAKPFTQQAKAK